MELTSIKNLTFKAKRNMMADIRYVRDSIKNSVKKGGNQIGQSKASICARKEFTVDEEDK